MPFSVSPARSASSRPPLACTVKGCSLPLERGERTYVCASGHSYDIARSGYVNLLQPQDRRSLHAGDSKEAVAARAALLEAGVGRTLIDAIADKGLARDLPERPVIVDLGSGTGDALAAIARRRAIIGVGLDLSTPAAEHAARRFPALTWVVANADRRLPLLESSVDLVLSLNGRRNPEETARALKPRGILMIALPAPDDLIELRAAVQGDAVERDRSEAMLAAHLPLFELVDRAIVSETSTLDRDALLSLLRGTYRGARHTWAERVSRIARMPVTLASEVFVLRCAANVRDER
jgi:23S rRNA (guanine745-N1)-methyltransferase